MRKNFSLAAPALIFFSVESIFVLIYSSKTPVFYALSFAFWGILAFGSVLFLRSRAGRAFSAVLPAAVFGAVLLLKILPGRITAFSNIAAFLAAAGLFATAVLLVRRAEGPSRRPFSSLVAAAIFALTDAILSFLVLPELPVDRPGLQIGALFLAGWLLPLFLIWMSSFGARPGRPAVLMLGAAALFFPRGSRAPVAAASPLRPNIVLIVMDTARRAELSIYGSMDAATPGLARLASDGVVFDRAYANANWTIPSHACLLTGFLSSITRTNFQDARTGDLAPLSSEFKTAATLLRESGYRTASFPANSYNLCRRYGFDQGFDKLWNGTPRDVNLIAALLAYKLVRSPKAAGWLTRRLPLEEYIAADDLNAKIFRWLDGRGAEPFFLFVNYAEPHGTNVLPREIRKAFGVSDPPPLWTRDPKTGVPVLDETDRAAFRKWYAAEIGALDAAIDRLLERLRERGLYENTLVAVTSDHGELLGEHGDFGHVVWLYEPTIHIPLVVKYPAGASAGTRSGRLVSHVDVFAEIVSKAGLTLPANIQGRPFEAAPHPVISEYRPTSAFAVPWPERYGYGQTSIVSALADGFKLIRSDGGREELFDLRADPSESLDVPDPEVRKAVGRELDEALDGLGTIRRLYNEHFKKVRFNSLGYVK